MRSYPRRPAAATTETYVVAYSHADDRADESPRFYGEPPLGQTLAQALSDIRDKVAGGYAVETVFRWDHAARIGSDATQEAAQALANQIGDWHDGADANALDDFCTGELGYSPLREMWRDAEEAPVRESINGRAAHGARGGLSALSVTLAAFVGAVVWVGWLNGFAP